MDYTHTPQTSIVILQPVVHADTTTDTNNNGITGTLTSLPPFSPLPSTDPASRVRAVIHNCDKPTPKLAIQPAEQKLNHKTSHPTSRAKYQPRN
jgi:hypothetical protein